MTQQLFRDDAYMKTCEAQVTGVNERGGILLDQTIFYATSGGQPGDSGTLKSSNGQTIKIGTTIYGENKSDIIHVPFEGQSTPKIGDKVESELDWERRHKHMRVHTALHILSVAVPYPVTGGQISDTGGRLDFDIPEQNFTKESVTQKVNEIITADYKVTDEWITDEELASNPGLVKTMSVKPPVGAGKVRLVRIGTDIDLQPCGGTHVKSTGEIGPIEVTKIENKGKQNRRIRVSLT